MPFPVSVIDGKALPGYLGTSLETFSSEEISLVGINCPYWLISYKRVVFNDLFDKDEDDIKKGALADVDEDDEDIIIVRTLMRPPPDEIFPNLAGSLRILTAHLFNVLHKAREDLFNPVCNTRRNSRRSE